MYNVRMGGGGCTLFFEGGELRERFRTSLVSRVFRSGAAVEGTWAEHSQVSRARAEEEGCSGKSVLGV